MATISMKRHSSQNLGHITLGNHPSPVRLSELEKRNLRLAIKSLNTAIDNGTTRKQAIVDAGDALVYVKRFLAKQKPSSSN